MRSFTLHLDGTQETARLALGAVACANVRAPGGGRALEKGQAVSEEDLAALEELRGVELSLVMPDAGDLHEDEAALRLGRAAAGPGVIAEGPVEARARLAAAHRGLLHVDTHTLATMNGVAFASIYTLFGGQPVEAGQIVAEAKVTPLLVPATEIERVEALAVSPPVSVLPFKPTVAAALIRERHTPDQARRVADALSKKLEWFGSSLGTVRYIAHDASSEAVGKIMRELLEGAAMLFAAGGSAINPADPLINALPHVPAHLERIGVPTHPGSLLWLAHTDRGDLPILGVPSCGMFSKSTALDILLPHLLTGESVTTQTLAQMGHGGLLRKDDWRLLRAE